MSTHDTEAFRTRYRASIRRWYNAWLHGGFVFGYPTRHTRYLGHAGLC